MITGTFQIYKREDGRWGYRLLARNWVNVGPAQGYASKRGAIRGVDAHIRAASHARVVVLPEK